MSKGKKRQYEGPWNASKPRNWCFTIRMTKLEYDRLTRLANFKGCNRSRLVRGLIRGAYFDGLYLQGVDKIEPGQGVRRKK